jgi:hypothetical protein
MNAPLAGLTAVALEQAVAAPFCTARLADAGARVIKVEQPEGDFARLYDEATPAGSSYFVWLNRTAAGKLSQRAGLSPPSTGAHTGTILCSLKTEGDL